MAELPPGFRVRLRDDVRRLDQGRLLLGGSPLRAVRLSAPVDTLAPGGVVEVAGPGTATLARRLLAGNLADPLLDTPVAASLLTVVVPAYGRTAPLERCLAALGSPAGPGEDRLRVLVVDDASPDPAVLAEVVARHGAELLRLEANVGPASARNAGLARVATPYVAFVDSDVEAPGAMLCGLAAHLADPAVALAGPHVRSTVHGARGSWWQRYDAADSSLALGERACAVTPGAAVAWLPSACLVGRVRALREVGGFAAGLRVGEDVDLVWRLVAAGRGVRYDPAFEAGHEVRGTMREWLGRKVLYGSGGAMLAERHGDAVAPAVLSPAMGLAALAVLQRRWWSVPAAAAGVLWGARQVRASLPEMPGRTDAAVRVATRGLGWALRQEAALATRHWWPATALACLVSARARRTLVGALLVDAVVQVAVDRPALDPVRGWAGRRLDDLAYGTGLWLGALPPPRRLARLRCLAPRIVLPRRRPPARAPHPPGGPSPRACPGMPG